MFDLHTAAEENASTPIYEDEYRLALPAARRKLEYINNRYGTCHGESYLAILISETVKAQRLTRYLEAVNNLMEMARQNGLESRLSHS